MSSNKEIWVLLEADDRRISSQSAALLDEGQRLASDLGGELHAIFLGPAIDDINKNVGGKGVRKLYLNDDTAFQQYDPALYEGAMLDLLSGKQPLLLLALSSSVGLDLMPRLSFKLGCPLITNCADIDMRENGEIQFIKPVQKGRLFATVHPKGTGMNMATFLPERLLSGDAQETAQSAAEIVKISMQKEKKASSIKVTGFVKADHRTIDISEAEVIVAVGRGVESKESFKAIEQFADQVGAAIGGTRPMVDARIIPYERQIGQTGKRVSPKLIFLFGISGATEFMQGVANTGTSVAINIDRQAPIFKSVDLGVVGNIDELTPELRKHLNGLTKRS